MGNKCMDIRHRHRHRHRHHRHQTSIGVRTRAKTRTLALQRLQNPKPRSKSTPCSSNSSSSSSKSSSCYLQLRSRRLEKCFASKTQNPSPKTNPSSSSKEVEVSLGEIGAEVEGKSSRNSRESTPCSLIMRDSDIVKTPGSTNRPTSSTTTNPRIQGATQRNFQTSSEMEEFFSVPEKRQQKEFLEKYNFDPAKDCPLPGRYEWVKL